MILFSTQITNHAVLLSAGLPVHTVSTPKIGKLHVATSIVVLADDARLRLERQQQSFSNALDALRRTVEKDIQKVEEKHKEKFTMHQNTLAAIEHAARKIGA
jgi:ribosome-associated translation inhibitor RaiA